MTALSVAGLVLANALAASSAEPAPDGFLVDLRDDVSEQDILEIERTTGIDLVANSIVSGSDKVFLLQDLDPGELEKLKADPRVDAAEPNFLYGIPEEELADEALEPTDKPPTTAPNDPLYKSQWHMAMIGMEDAWKSSQGKGAIVAVIDTGVSDGRREKKGFPRVPDLEGTTFVPGYNFVADNEFPDDDHAHGTHVAGTIAQTTNNAFGVTGVAPRASIMPLKVLSKQGWGTAADIANAIRWAADHGAHVINMSLGGGGYSSAMANAVKYAHSKGVIVVCAASNTGRGRVEYPAAYPGALAVSSVGPDGNRAWYSSYGKETFIAAPGGDTRVDLNKDGIADGVLQDTIVVGDPTKHGFFPFQGTSMATPHVAGVAALIVARGVTNPDKVAEVLAKSAEPRQDRAQFGNGVLNAAGAMSKVADQDTTRAGWTAAILALLAFGARRRLASQRAKIGFSGVVTALVVGAGLFPLRSLLGDLPGASLLASPLPMWDGVLFDAGPSALLCSVLLPLVPALFLLGVGKLRGVLIGLAAGTSAFLLSEAFGGLINVSFIPGFGLLDTAWLLVQGVLALGLGWLLMRR